MSQTSNSVVSQFKPGSIEDDDGYWVIRGRLPPETGALVQQVLEQVMEEQYQELQDVPAERV